MPVVNIIPCLMDFSHPWYTLKFPGVNFDLSPWEPKKEEINLEKAWQPSFFFLEKSKEIKWVNNTSINIQCLHAHPELWWTSVFLPLMILFQMCSKYVCKWGAERLAQFTLQTVGSYHSYFLFLLNIYTFQKWSDTLEWFVSNGSKISIKCLPLALLWSWSYFFKERQYGKVGRLWILGIDMNLKPGWLTTIHVVGWTLFH